MLSSPTDAAILTVLNIVRARKASNAQLRRVRVSEKTLRRITGRRRLEGRFLEDYAQELLELGWVIIRTDKAWGFMRASVVEGWPRVTSETIGDEINTLARPEPDDVMTRARIELGIVPDDQVADEG